MLHRDVAQFEWDQNAVREGRAARAAAAGQTGSIAAGSYTVTELLDLPDPVVWQVHCDACNPHTDTATGLACEGCYSFGVERCATWAQLVDWTAHLMDKPWVIEATNSAEFIRAAVHADSEVGLLCRPEERYRDA
ncbi:hypothetical protein AD006_30160 (plasmid) [Pseudonocardia sp. EC080610-09]|uniref:hypothetical protein n=1 Tax=unclassified Pseudonocardia TaxID=2619320 RepID=UPI0007069C0D|nr:MULTISPECIES: hypothetical protein [unclassified Pseudonocardia]ALL79502.1 hypothetical protein AD006_30160 [Pseudonocardia sp. EC080610-09]ALL85546.1 hypothetical protein AD017_31090 [Pseudonocardia sp. EC080619-01]